MRDAVPQVHSDGIAKKVPEVTSPRLVDALLHRDEKVAEGARASRLGSLRLSKRRQPTLARDRADRCLESRDQDVS